MKSELKIQGDRDSIALVCSADENYAMPLTVMVYSAIANLKNVQQKVDLFVLDGGITSATKAKVAKSLDPNRVTIHWVKLDPDLFANLPVSRHLTIAAYYRLLIPEVVPPNFDKVIYLDCDMIVRGDLSELWQIDIGDRYVLAVQDDNQPYISMAAGLQNYKELGLNPHDKFFNSGLLVINLAKWRDEAIGAKVLEFSNQNRDFIRDADQDGLNAVLAGKWGELDPRWNQMPRIYDYLSWQDSSYDAKTYQALRRDPLIIHYTNAPKPWRIGCVHPATDLFFYYHDKTAWLGWRSIRYLLWMQPLRLLWLLPIKTLKNYLKLAAL
ncbi:MAG: glycosyltransferase family 8 protein, partial [Microcoleus sp. SIO2G3]|nr:glycosyltransferase family 8 protein [Microcoleus sp. SIO2G3]